MKSLNLVCPLDQAMTEQLPNCRFLTLYHHHVRLRKKVFFPGVRLTKAVFIYSVSSDKILQESCAFCGNFSHSKRGYNRFMLFCHIFSFHLETSCCLIRNSKNSYLRSHHVFRIISGSILLGVRSTLHHVSFSFDSRVTFSLKKGLQENVGENFELGLPHKKFLFLLFRFFFVPMHFHLSRK